MNLDSIVQIIESAVDIYEKTSPYVYNYLDDLYIRINENPDNVILSELFFVSRLDQDGWLHPNTAQNDLYHLLERLGRPTTGILAF